MPRAAPVTTATRPSKLYGVTNSDPLVAVAVAAAELPCRPSTGRRQSARSSFKIGDHQEKRAGCELFVVELAQSAYFPSPPRRRTLDHRSVRVDGRSAGRNRELTTLERRGRRRCG